MISSYRTTVRALLEEALQKKKDEGSCSKVAHHKSPSGAALTLSRWRLRSSADHSVDTLCHFTSLPAERAESLGLFKDCALNTEGAVLSARTVPESPLTFGSEVVAGQAACVQQSSPHPQADEPRPSSVRRDSVKPSARPFPGRARNTRSPTRFCSSTPVAPSGQITPPKYPLWMHHNVNTRAHTHTTCPRHRNKSMETYRPVAYNPRLVPQPGDAQLGAVQ
ncbi:hypothetical protein GBF38_007421 [Nibea albiflora]|uniref:Uncharacterized protein n=1 Tax=Nibea albiflora TaxID=240163 RepID=A0ACB7EHT6_NIBAL|nr:hypothetical protein GBF38_007421 [Nibea albiflora]